jgi:hypothetical protein
MFGALGRTRTCKIRLGGEQFVLLAYEGIYGCSARIRTWVSGVKGRGPAARRKSNNRRLPLLTYSLLPSLLHWVTSALSSDFPSTDSIL